MFIVVSDFLVWDCIMNVSFMPSLKIHNLCVLTVSNLSATATCITHHSVTRVSNGKGGWADLILTKAPSLPPPLPVHCYSLPWLKLTWAWDPLVRAQLSIFQADDWALDTSAHLSGLNFLFFGHIVGAQLSSKEWREFLFPWILVIFAKSEKCSSAVQCL